MNKIFKKSLALTVSAALCLTAFIGCLSVSAETVTPVGNITIGSTEVQVGSTDEFTLPVTIEKGTSNGIAAARFAFSVPSQLEFLGADKTDDHCIPAWSNNGEAPVTVDGEYIVIAEATNDKSGKDVATFDRGTFNLKFKLAEGAAAGTYSLTMSTKYHEACDTGTLTTDGSYGDETLFDLAAKGDTSFGQVTVKEASTEPVYNEDVKVLAKNASFDSDYSLVFAVPTSTPEGWKIVAKQDEYVADADNSSSYNTLSSEPRVTELTVANVEATATVKGVACHLVYLRGIAVKKAANGVKIQLFQKVNGVDSYGPEEEYGLVTYAMNQINKTNGNQSFKDAMKAFLNYVSAVQMRFNYNSNNLANAALDDADKVYDCENDISNLRNDDYKTVENPVSTVRRYAPSYEDKTVLAMAFVMPENYADYSLKIAYTTVAGVEVEKIISFADSTEMNISGVSHRMMSYGDVAFKDMRVIVYSTIIDSNGVEVSNTGAYSFESYAASRATTSKDYNAARSMINFGDKFRTYKGF